MPHHFMRQRPDPEHPTRRAFTRWSHRREAQAHIDLLAGDLPP
jgi:hypothetical protein